MCRSSVIDTAITLKIVTLIITNIKKQASFKAILDLACNWGISGKFYRSLPCKIISFVYFGHTNNFGSDSIGNIFSPLQ